MKFSITGNVFKVNELYPDDKPHDEIGKRFPGILSRTEREVDAINAIRIYKELLKVNAAINPEYYEKIILHLCRLLEKNRLYGEELYYRLSCRYYFDNIINVNKNITRNDKINSAYNNIIMDLKKSAGKLKIIVSGRELQSIHAIIEVVKTTGNHQIQIFPIIENITGSNPEFLENIDLIICFDQHPNAILKRIKTFGARINQAPLFALYYKSIETAKNFFQQYKSEIDYFLYSETMIYSVLHIALKNRQAVLAIK